jgi:hypothetical protein
MQELARLDIHHVKAGVVTDVITCMPTTIINKGELRDEAFGGPDRCAKLLKLHVVSTTTHWRCPTALFGRQSAFVQLKVCR